MLKPYHQGKWREPRIGKDREYFGLELEFMPVPGAFPGDSGPHRFAAYLEKALAGSRFPAKAFRFEADSSLHQGDAIGVEMISGILASRLARKLPWEDFFRHLDGKKVSFGHPVAGFHIHLDRKSLSPLGWRLLWNALNAPDSDIEVARVFGRLSHYAGDAGEVEYDEYAFQYTDSDDEDVYDYETVTLRYWDIQVGDVLDNSEDFNRFFAGSRYVRLNCCPEKTAEFRAFPSPHSGEQVLAALELCLALRDAAAVRASDYGEMKPDRRSKPLPSLKDFLQDVVENEAYPRAQLLVDTSWGNLAGRC